MHASTTRFLLLPALLIGTACGKSSGKNNDERAQGGQQICSSNCGTGKTDNTKPGTDTPDPKPTLPTPDLVSFEQKADGTLLVTFNQTLKDLGRATWSTGEALGPVEWNADRSAFTFKIPERVLKYQYAVPNLYIQGLITAETQTYKTIQIPIDNKAPELQSATMDSDDVITFRFGEAIILTEGTQIKVNGRLYQRDAMQGADDGLSITLAYGVKLKEGETIAFEILNAVDRHGNAQASLHGKVSFGEDRKGPEVQEALQIRSVVENGRSEISLQVTFSEALAIKKGTLYYYSNGTTALRFAEVLELKEDLRTIIFKTSGQHFDHLRENLLQFEVKDLAGNKSMVSTKLVIDTAAPQVLRLDEKSQAYCQMLGVQALRCRLNETELKTVQILPVLKWYDVPFKHQVQTEADGNHWLHLTFETAVPENAIQSLRLIDDFTNFTDTPVQFIPASVAPAFVKVGAAGRSRTGSVMELVFTRPVASVESIEVDSETFKLSDKDYTVTWRSGLAAIRFKKPIAEGTRNVILHKVLREGNAAAVLDTQTLKGVEFGGSAALIHTAYTEELAGQSYRSPTFYTNQFHMELTQEGRNFELFQQGKNDELIPLTDVTFQQKLPDPNDALQKFDNPRLTVQKNGLEGLTPDRDIQVLVLKVDGKTSLPFEVNWSTVSIRLSDWRSSWSKQLLSINLDANYPWLDEAVISLSRNNEPAFPIPRTWLSWKKYYLSEIQLDIKPEAALLSGSYVLTLEKLPAGPLKAPLPSPIVLKFEL